MLRITPIYGDHQVVTVRLEGNVSGPWEFELRKVCEEILASGRNLSLNLEEVSFLDHAGISLLKTLEARGVGLMDCSMFVREQLKAAP